jgi:poly(hydroxyalkanoate) depolymerase family esterase
MKLLPQLRRWFDGALQRLRRIAPGTPAASDSRAPRDAHDLAWSRVQPRSVVAGLRTWLTRDRRGDLTPGVAADEPTGEAIDQQRIEINGEFREYGFRCRAGARQYKLFLPPAVSSRPMPLLVMLHGCKQTPDEFAVGTRMNDLARRHGVAVVYPAQSRTHNVSRCWNWFRVSDQVRGGGEPEIIASLTKDLVQRYGLDARRVYVAGLSAGGTMAAILGDAYPDVYAAVGVHSSVPHGVAVGFVSGLALMRHGRAEASEDREFGGGLASLPGVPVIVFHGDADPTVNPRSAIEVYARSASRASADESSRDPNLRESVESGVVPDGRAFTRTRRRGANAVPISELWVVHGSGHAWSGGDARGSFTDPRGPDASAEMLRFLLAHSR